MVAGGLTAHFFPVVVERFLRFGLSGGLAAIPGVLPFNMCAERFIDHFIGFLLRIVFIGLGLFDTDDLRALRALAEEVTGAIHFVLWSKPGYVGQFRCCHGFLPFPLLLGARLTFREQP